MVIDLYEKYKKLDIDFSPIGLAYEENEPYFCTPIGAEVIGWDNGLHYCFIKGFEEMVFAVNPESSFDYYVYPLAKNFNDFLRLLISTKNTNTLQQIILWDNQRFVNFISNSVNVKYDNSSKVTSILNILKDKLKITEMPTPFEYVKEIQKDFDCSRIPFSDEFYNVTGKTKP
ncbi:MAG: hypothetical protein R3Y54_07900 [Eubacteriales bacterium]